MEVHISEVYKRQRVGNFHPAIAAFIQEGNTHDVHERLRLVCCFAACYNLFYCQTCIFIILFIALL